MESTPGEDTVKVVEMTVKDLEYYVNLVDKAGQGLRELTPILKEVLLWVKWYQTASHATKKSFMKGRASRCRQTSLLSYFKKLPRPPQPSP